MLVVDDNATNRKVVHHQLALWGTTDTSVSGADEALAALRIAARRWKIRST